MDQALRDLVGVEQVGTAAVLGSEAAPCPQEARHEELEDRPKVLRIVLLK